MTTTEVKTQLDSLVIGQCIRISDNGLYAVKSNISGAYLLSAGGYFGDLPLHQGFLDYPDLAILTLSKFPTRGTL